MSTAAESQPLDAQEPESTRAPWFDHLGTLLRVALGGLMIYAGWMKIMDIEQSVKAVKGYDITSDGIARLLGFGVPIIEILVGLLLVLGLFTRISALVIGLLMVAFIIAIGQAWARGLTIDCGCFGGGGEVASEDTRYLEEIIRDSLMLLAAAYLVWRPRSTASLDQALFGDAD